MKCSFCGNEITAGSGKLFVKSDGSAFYFCSSKCARNKKIRNPRHVKWTESYRQERVDSAAN